MENKVNYAIVGAFVLALSAILIAGVLWLAAGGNTQKKYAPYQSIIQESVAGLNLDAPVKYLGVDVGKVSAISIDPNDSRQVILRFLIERGTPIKQDTEPTKRGNPAISPAIQNWLVHFSVPLSMPRGSLRYPGKNVIFRYQP